MVEQMVQGFSKFASFGIMRLKVRALIVKFANLLLGGNNKEHHFYPFFVLL